jgi:hypothetical protein
MVEGICRTARAGGLAALISGRPGGVLRHPRAPIAGPRRYGVPGTAAAPVRRRRARLAVGAHALPDPARARYGQSYGLGELKTSVTLRRFH